MALIVPAVILTGCFGNSYALNAPANVRVNAENNRVMWDAVTSDNEAHTNIRYQIRWETAAAGMSHDWVNVTGLEWDPAQAGANGLGQDLPNAGGKIRLEVRAIADGEGGPIHTLNQTAYSRWVRVDWTRPTADA